jgi:hypothetical protein
MTCSYVLLNLEDHNPKIRSEKNLSIHMKIILYFQQIIATGISDIKSFAETRKDIDKFSLYCEL